MCIFYEHIQQYMLIESLYRVVRTNCSLHLSYILLDVNASYPEAASSEVLNTFKTPKRDALFLCVKKS